MADHGPRHAPATTRYKRPNPPLTAANDLHLGGLAGMWDMTATTPSEPLNRTPMLTVPDVAEKCSVSAATVREWHRKGVGPVWHRLGKHLRCEEADFVRWLAETADVVEQKAATTPAADYAGRWDD